MAKKEKSLEESKKKKVPFNVLRKGAIAGLLGLTLGFGCLGLAGCSLNGTDGKDGLNGKDGAQWYSGIETPTTQGVNGDFYLDTDDYILYQKTNGEWTVLMRDFGKPATATNIELQVNSGKVQWRYKTGDDTTWKDLIEVDTITGSDGKEIELQVGSEYIQWRYTTGTDTTWKNLMLISSLKGTDGATWLSGTSAPTTTQGKNGDFYLNESNYDIWKKSDGTWTKIGNIKGDKGDPGKDGVSVYVGYDGYIWEGKNRTEYKAQLDTTGRENVVEDTLSLKENKYFEIDTIGAGTEVALMSNYFEYIKTSVYSNSTITKLTTYVSANGKLDIGVVNLSTGAYTLKFTQDVVEGKNILTLNLELGENETLVLGGANTTVELYKSTGVDVTDEQGLFSSDLRTFALSNTANIKDKLLVSVEATFKKDAVVCSTPELESVYATRTSNYQSVVNTAAPFIYQDATKFAGQTVKSMKTFVNAVSYSDDVAVMHIALITVPGNFDVGTTIPSYDETYTIKLPKSFFNSATTINKWVEIDFTEYAYKSDGTKATEGIVVGENQTLVFAANKAEMVMWGFKNDSASWQVYDGEQFYQTSDNALKGNADGTRLNFLFYVNGKDDEKIEDRIERLETLNYNAGIEKQLASLLSGKNLSILGDSISTYTGVSNNSEENLSDNAVYYKTQISQSDTYWQQILTTYNMNLCVNNAWSGAYVSQHQPNVNADKDSDGSISSGMARAGNLAKADGTQPDYIIVYIGINDLNAGVSATTVASAYQTMLNTITSTYPNAKVFCLNMPNRNTGNSPVEYNNAIANAILQHDNVYLVDLYNSNFSGATYQTNSLDNLHPNAIGMDYMTNIIIEAMKDALLSD